MVTPFFRDDPTPLVEVLAEQARGLERKVEFLLFDDGSGDEALACAVESRIADLGATARLIRSPVNLGRAAARNRLVQAARGGHLLFVDAGVLPVRDNYLQLWLELAREGSTAVGVGGLEVSAAEPSHDTRLHRALAARSDCLSAEQRRRDPAKHVFTCNLLVRADAARAEPFDEGFVGWGWEDVEWGLRVGRRWPIRHLDNPVRNTRLDTTAGLIRKYREAAPNFARMVRAHPEAVTRFPAYQAASALKRAPLRKVWSSAALELACAERAPMRAREIALKLYRSGLYAEAL